MGRPALLGRHPSGPWYRGVPRPGATTGQPAAGKGVGRVGGGVGPAKERASQCACVCQNYPLANCPLVSPRLATTVVNYPKDPAALEIATGLVNYYAVVFLLRPPSIFYARENPRESFEAIFLEITSRGKK